MAGVIAALYAPISTSAQKCDGQDCSRLEPAAGAVGREPLAQPGSQPLAVSRRESLACQADNPFFVPRDNHEQERIYAQQISPEFVYPLQG